MVFARWRFVAGLVDKRHHRGEVLGMEYDEKNSFRVEGRLGEGGEGLVRHYEGRS